MTEQSDYPGRGVLVGRTAADDGDVLAIWLTGRSGASRGRYLDRSDDEIATRFLPSHGSDPEAMYRVYTAARWPDGWVVAGNGDHVAPLADRLREGTALAAALEAANYEEDPPIWTPRIVGALARGADAAVRYRLGQAHRTAHGAAAWATFAVARLEPGAGLALQTYQGDPVDVRPRVDVPLPVSVSNRAEEIAAAIHGALSPQLRVATAALVARPGRPLEIAVVNERMPGDQP